MVPLERLGGRLKKKPGNSVPGLSTPKLISDSLADSPVDTTDARHPCIPACRPCWSCIPVRSYSCRPVSDGSGAGSAIFSAIIHSIAIAILAGNALDCHLTGDSDLHPD